MGHRQGLACELWCKHKNERGIPIVQYNDRQNKNSNQQNVPPAQLNAVLVEGMVGETYIPAQHLDYEEVICSNRWGCDCDQCFQLQGLQENQVPDIMAVTRSKKQDIKKPARVRDIKEDPLQW